MKVPKSSTECEAYNANNAATIACGLLEAVEPDDRVLAEEKAIAERAAAGAAEAKVLADVLAQIGTDGVGLSIEKTYHGSGRWTPGRHTGWRIYIGNHRQNWKVIGTGTKLEVTPKQKETILAKVAEVKAEMNAHQNREAAENAAQARYRAMAKTNKELIAGITGDSYASDYAPKYFSVQEDGRIRYGSDADTFTIAQWGQIVALKKKHEAEIKMLKAELRKA